MPYDVGRDCVPCTVTSRIAKKFGLSATDISARQSSTEHRGASAESGADL